MSANAHESQMDWITGTFLRRVMKTELRFSEKAVLILNC